MERILVPGNAAVLQTKLQGPVIFLVLLCCCGEAIRLQLVDAVHVLLVQWVFKRAVWVVRLVDVAKE